MRPPAPARAADVALVVLGVSETVPDLRGWDEADDSALRPVDLCWVTWDDLADCPHHPAGDEFKRYIHWKRALGSAAIGGSES